MALTEPGGGTDVSGMQCNAVRVSGGDYVLNGEKSWITNAPVGDYFLLFARTGEGRRDISLFLVGGEMAGFRRGSAEEKMGMRSSPTGSLILEDCVVSAECLVGDVNGAFGLLLEHLSVERLGLAAMSCGIALECVHIMSGYASERVAFGKSLDRFGQIQRYLARSGSRLCAARNFLYQVAGYERDIKGFGYYCDAVKLFASEVGEEVSRAGIQILGANGYSRDYGVERGHRDSILLSIGGGTSEALEKNMSRLRHL